jgi:hypothetical protein
MEEARAFLAVVSFSSRLPPPPAKSQHLPYLSPSLSSLAVPGTSLREREGGAREDDRKARASYSILSVHRPALQAEIQALTIILTTNYKAT